MKNVVSLLVHFYWDVFLVSMQLDVWQICSHVYSKGRAVLVYLRQFLVWVHSHRGGLQSCVTFPLAILFGFGNGEVVAGVTASLMTQRRSDSTSWHIFLSFLCSAYEWDFVWLQSLYDLVRYGWYLERRAPLYPSTTSNAGCLEANDFWKWWLLITLLRAVFGARALKSPALGAIPWQWQNALPVTKWSMDGIVLYADQASGMNWLQITNFQQQIMIRFTATEWVMFETVNFLPAYS